MRRPEDAKAQDYANGAKQEKSQQAKLQEIEKKLPKVEINFKQQHNRQTVMISSSKYPRRRELEKRKKTWGKKIKNEKERNQGESNSGKHSWTCTR